MVKITLLGVVPYCEESNEYYQESIIGLLWTLDITVTNSQHLDYT